MNLKEETVIEPAEIITASKREGVLSKKYNPYFRFLARMVDYGIIGFVWYYLLNLRCFWWFSIPMLIWVPIEGLLLSFIGFTPGKWLLRIKVRDVKWQKLTLKNALLRSINVWIQGMGVGINVLYYLTMLISLQKLQRFGITPWDKEGLFLVIHEPVKQNRLIFALILAITGFIGVWLC